MRERYTDWAAIKWGRLRIHRTCQLCNSPNHHANDCWQLPHAYYCGLIRGRIAGSKKLTRIDNERDAMAPTPDELQPIYEWAHKLTYGDAR